MSLELRQKTIALINELLDEKLPGAIAKRLYFWHNGWRAILGWRSKHNGKILSPSPSASGRSRLNRVGTQSLAMRSLR
ncbi:MAG: hypothetical protein AAGA60_04675 [Cyanobacteria bacterium P01_E01_bin.42]